MTDLLKPSATPTQSSTPVGSVPHVHEAGRRDGRRRGTRPNLTAATAALVSALMATSLGLRLADLGSWLWIDEGISVGVASHHLSQIPGLLGQDGSPPLYYLALHGWIVMFGTSEAATHALSLTLSVATIPLALWAGWSLFDRRVGWTFAAMMAFNPYLSYFATEARMYSLVVLLALVATASFLHAFAFGRRRYLWLFAPSLALVLYTHNWGLWLAAGAVAALVPCAAAAADRRRFWRDAGATFGVVGLAYLPWLPTLVFQRAHTGAPWSSVPLPREAVSVVAAVFGDPLERVLVVLLFVAGPLLWSLLRERAPRRPALAALAVMVVVPVALGWIGAQVSPSWAPRYLAVCAPALMLLAAVGLGLAGKRGVVALVLIVVFWIQPVGWLSGRRPARSLADKATVQPLARTIAVGLKPDDLVIVMQMEEVPVLAYYLPKSLRFATAVGPVVDPGVVDWRDALARMQAGTVASALQPALDHARVGTDIVLVCAEPGTGPTSLPWFALMETRCTQWRSALEADHRFVRVRGGIGPESAGVPPRQVLEFTKTAN